MKQVLIYSLLLVSGILGSQFFDLESARWLINLITMACLAYIMIEVGLEFTINKKNLKSYGVDYAVAATAAAFPWIFCAVYFVTVFGTEWKEALLVGRFAAPTSAGVLFTMLAAAGLASTWLFKKARVLAIFDDLDTVLLMIPLKIMIVGLKPELFMIVAIIFVLLWAAYKWLHVLKWSTGKFAVLGYGIVIVGICKAIEVITHIHLEVLLPAFVMGCILYNPYNPEKPQEHSHEHTHLEPENGASVWLDRGIKAAFMFLVGCSLPKIELGDVSWGMAAVHVIGLTLISNIGKCFASFCYQKEASLEERIALSIAMFPRGEVGAGVLLVSIGYGMTGLPVTLAGLSLALNLVLTGVFISIVIQYLKKADRKKMKRV